MSKERQLTKGAATFIIYDKTLHHRDDDPFVLWLKAEGFKPEYFGHSNCDNAVYVNINTKVYTWAMAGVGLSPIIGNHAITIHDFKQIYAILNKYKDYDFSIYTEEEQKRADEQKYRNALAKEQSIKAQQEYFAKKPCFEEWLNDVAECIVNDAWYKEHKPDYTKADILVDAEDGFIDHQLRMYYAEQFMPSCVAHNWDIIAL